MPYAGKKLLPREVAAATAKQWKNRVNHCKATATILGESQGSVGAWHDNEKAGAIWSRDCGPAQISIAAKFIDTSYEERLRTDSLDPEVYGPVVENNIEVARALYDSPMTRDGKPSKRFFQPWYAYTNGWCIFPEWWVWARPDLDHWAPTGRYIQKAICGVANYHLLIRKGVTQQEALVIAQDLARTFEVEGYLSVRATGVWWPVKPPKPTEPPPDGIGPRPITNDGM